LKRLTLAASTTLTLAVALPATAQAQLSQSQTHAYFAAYARVQQAMGNRAPGCLLLGKHATCHGAITDQRVLNSTAVLNRLLGQTATVARASTPAPTSSAPASAPAPVNYGGGLSNVPGVPASFASCVAFRESTDGQLSSNIYGIEGAGGTGSITEQKQAFAAMYAARGTEPWAQYDGC